ncbi:hypothetical protein UPYG_G00014160 [Umbra pygmaea]|uniref:Sushi domain-containing protein n=1 Tax=Umbra pygmaea TaxID=75934 RepID=A0ABD0XME4_UMBPY
MSTVTASVADGSKTIYSMENGNPGRNYNGQCTPIPLPALGTQKIIKGNGTNVGTVITLQCPARHLLVGGNEVSCVWGHNSTTQWTANFPWCKSVSWSEDFGFRVAVMASIISCAIILLMSMAFITCCLLDCVKDRDRKKDKRETDLWHQLELAEQEDSKATRYGHKSRNNNNNNTQMETLPAGDNCDHPPVDLSTASWCHNALPGPVPSSTSGPALNSAPLPCRGYTQPLLMHKTDFHHNPGLCINTIGPHYAGSAWTAGQTQDKGVAPVSGQARQTGGEEHSVSTLSTALLEKDYTMRPVDLYG